MTTAYAGDVAPVAALEALKSDPDAVLIDVRTLPECQFVGVPDLSPIGKDAMHIEWQSYPDMFINTGFTEEIAARGVETDQPIYLLCRSGVRSVAAAKVLAEAGYKACFNVLEGFEGDKDDQGCRGTVGGWRYHNLPWRHA